LGLGAVSFSLEQLENMLKCKKERQSYSRRFEPPAVTISHFDSAPIRGLRASAGSFSFRH
jgi:hypothetical protein